MSISVFTQIISCRKCRTKNRVAIDDSLSNHNAVCGSCKSVLEKIMHPLLVKDKTLSYGGLFLESEWQSVLPPIIRRGMELYDALPHKYEARIVNIFPQTLEELQKAKESFWNGTGAKHFNISLPPNVFVRLHLEKYWQHPYWFVQPGVRSKWYIINFTSNLQRESYYANIEDKFMKLLLSIPELTDGIYERERDTGM